MQSPLRHRPKSNRARIASFARLWLACIAALLTCAEHLLSPALQRRLPVLDIPRAALARAVAHLILICACERAGPPTSAGRAQMREAGAIRALMRAGLKRHLTNTHGAYDLARIARTCADPEAAIADMAAALEAGLTRRHAITPRAAHDALRQRAPHPIAQVCDTS